MKKYLVLIFFLYSRIAQSQNVSLTANVVNPENMPLSGNVILVDSSDNMLLGNYFENGKIDLSFAQKGFVLLKITSLGFQDFQQAFIVDTQNIQLGNVQLNAASKDLREFVLVATKPMFEKTTEGTKVNVENSLLSKSANANELLGRIPTVSVSGNKVNVFGRGEALLILNGKEITFESFKSLPPSDIKSIEIITNPDARYDAKGKAVVLISMQKYYSQGTSVTLVNSTTSGLIKNKPLGEYTMNAANITFNFRKNKWDFNSYYANELGTSWSENKFITSSGSFKKYGYYTENNHNTSVHYYRAGLGYKLNEHSSVSAQYDGLSHFFKLDVLQNGDYYSDEIFVSKINMANAATTKLLNHSANINYYNEKGEKGNTLFIGVQYNQFQNKLLDNIVEIIDTNSYNRINDNLNSIQLYTAQTDYSHKLKKGSVDIGTKFSTTTNEGNIQFFSKKTSETIYSPNTSIANNTLYTEYVPAAYIVYKYVANKLTTSLGIRWEHTLAHSKSILYDSVYFKNSYSDVFPSAKLHYSLNDSWKLSTSYAYKINRPLYQDMDPFLWYLDSLTGIRGNALLKPEYLHQSEIKLTFKSISLRYAYTLSKRTINSVMMANPVSPSPNAVIFTKDNIQQRTIQTVAIETPYEKGNYSTYTSCALNIYQYKDNRVEYTTLKSIPQLYLYTYHTYKIPAWFTAEFTAEYYGNSLDGLTKRKPYYYFTIALSRSFLKEDALNVNLLWNDFANTAQAAGKFTANTFSNEYKQKFTLSYLRLTLTYNLTSKTKFNYNNKNVNEAEFNRIKK